MSQKVRRMDLSKRNRQRSRTRRDKAQGRLQLENLEQRLLLDVAGWWDELGYRSGSGGGVSWDTHDSPGDSQLVLTSDGDPVVIWSEGPLTEFVDSNAPLPLQWWNEGDIYVRQYAGAASANADALPGWWDLGDGSADTESIGTGRQICAAAGPTGEIVVAWVTGTGNDSEVHARMWDGSDWVEMADSATDGGVSDDEALNENPSVTISPVGEVFISYTALLNDTQREVVVKRFGYDFSQGVQVVGPLDPDSRVWAELRDADTPEFGTGLIGGVSADDGTSFASSVTTDLEGRPIIAWASSTGEDQAEIYVRRWDGSTWQELGVGSASDPNGDGRSGVSDNVGHSIEPDIAVAPNGDVYATWVDWADWENYDNPDTGGGKAGVFVKVLQANTSTWTSVPTQHAHASDSDEGIADTQGWYYRPEISIDSNSRPFITWQGYGAGERYVIDRDRSNFGGDPTPNLPDNEHLEFPSMSGYASHFDGAAFGLLSDATNIRNTATPENNICWMPTGVVGENDELIIAYTWRDALADAFTQDNEIYVQIWDDASTTWDAFGRGSNSNGNDLIGGDGDWGNTQQIGLIDYSNNASNPDVMVGRADPDSLNGGQLFRYDREDDAWHADIDLPGGIGFGKAFDLRGEPEVEFNVQGNPLLAYLDDVTGLPYVYHWAGAAWSLVGGASAGAVVGNTTDNGAGNVGISVQAGPDGQILLAYLAHTTSGTQDSDDVVARLWTGAAWVDAGSGVVDKTPGWSPLYYNDFDGWSFSSKGDGTQTDVTEVTIDADTGAITPQPNAALEDPYQHDTWYFRPDFGEAEAVRDLVTGDVSPDDAPSGYTGATGDHGLVMTFTEPADGGDDAAAAAGQTIESRFDYAFTLQSWSDDVIIDFAYAIDASGFDDARLTFNLLVDGAQVDADLSTPGVTDSFAQVNAGAAAVPYSILTTYRLDLQEYGITLSPGLHYVSFQGVMDNLADDAADPEATGTLEFDNVAVYERIVPETSIRQTFEADPLGGTWTFTPDPDAAQAARTTAAWDADGGYGGTGDAGIIMSLGTAAAADAGLRGDLSFDFTLADTINAEELSLDLNYRLMNGANVPVGETLDLIIAVDGTDITTVGDYRVTGPGADSGYTGLSVEFDDLGLATLAAGDHTVSIRAQLSNSAALAQGGATIYIDNAALFGRLDTAMSDFEPAVGGAYSLGDAWTFTPDPTSAAQAAQTVGVWDGDAGSGGAGDGGLMLTLGDDADAQAGLLGTFDYAFSVTDSGSPVAVDFKYQLTTGAGLAGQTLALAAEVMDDAGATLGLPIVTVNVVGANQNSGYVALADQALAVTLSEGDYILQFRGTLTNSPLAGGATGVIQFDDVNLIGHGVGNGVAYLDSGTHTGIPNGQWEIEQSGDVGGNDAVGPIDDDSVRLFDFQANSRSMVTGSDPFTSRVQSFTIEDIVTPEDGPMVVGFRYRLNQSADFDNTHINVTIDGVPYNADGDNLAIVLPDYSLSNDTRWWNLIQDEPEYTYVYVQAPDIDAGTHTVRIEVAIDNVAEDAEIAQFWIDNVSIVGAQSTDIWKPIATLLPNRNFAVAITNESPGLSVYGNDDESPIPDGTIRSWNAGDFLSAYYTATIFGLDQSTDTWQRYGDNLEFTQGIDFMGFTLKDNVQGAEAVSGLGNYTYEMPGAELYILEDLVIGPNSLEWVALQHATSDWVDTDSPADGVLDRFDLHPWDSSDPPDYWTVAFTTLDIHVLRWDPFSPPDNTTGDPDRWVNTALTPIATNRAYTWPQLVSSGGQLPTVAWTNRGSIGTVHDMHAQRYEPTGQWGILNTESVQNDIFWSALTAQDMIVRPDGFPIAAFRMGHLDSNGIREFRPEYQIPDVRVEEQSGETANDDLLEFGSVSVSTGPSDESFTVYNDGLADLTIYGIDIGGYGDLATSPFGLRDDLIFPMTVAPGENRSFGIRFDPTGVPQGDYSAVLVLHTDDPTHPDHPFGHYYELGMEVRVPNDANVVVDPDPVLDGPVEFDDTVVNELSTTRSVTIGNNGLDDLNLSEWFFDGNNFLVSQAYVTAGETVTAVSATNGVGAADDVLLAPNSFITLILQFAPDEVGAFSETLYVHTNDTELEYVQVGMLGVGISGASLVVTENSGTANDDLLEFGPVVIGGSKTETITILNDGSTLLTITSVTDIDPNSTLIITPFVDDRELLPGASFDVTIQYAPSESDLDIPLETIIRILSDDPDIEDALYEIEVTGTPVPQIPILQVTEIATAEDPDDDGLVRFGDANLQTPVSRFITIENVGGADMTLESFQLTDTNAFAVMPTNDTNNNGDDQTLAPGETLTLELFFSPNLAGDYDKAIYIWYYDENGLRTAEDGLIYLQGRGVDPVISVTDSQGDPDDGEIDFGPVGQNLSSTTQTVTINNVGNTDLSVTNWALTTGSATVFAVDPFVGTIVLEAGESTSFEVVFTPDAVAGYNGVVTVSSNDANNPALTIDLIGQGVQPGTATVTDSQGASGDLYINYTPDQPIVYGVGQTVEHTVTVHNTGAGELLLKGLGTSSNVFLLDQALDLNDDSDDITIPSGGSYTATVTFSPANAFDGTSQLLVTTSDPQSATPDVHTSVTLEGEAIYAAQAGEGAPSPIVRWRDASGTPITVIVIGGGGAVILGDDPLSVGTGDIDQIILNGTTTGSLLMINAPGGTTISSISGGSLGMAMLSSVTLDGAGLQLDSLGAMLMLGNLTNGADAIIDGVASAGTMVQAGNLDDGSDLTVDGTVRMLRVNTAGDGTISTGDLGFLMTSAAQFDANVNVNGDLNFANLSARRASGTFYVDGDVNFFNAGQTDFTGALRADNIVNAMFKSLNSAAVSVSGEIRSLRTSNDFVDSLVLGGYDLGTDGRLGGTGSAADSLHSGGEVIGATVSGRIQGSFVAAGVAPDAFGNFFNPTATATGSVGTVRFGRNLDSGAPFGVAAHTNIDTVLLNNREILPGETLGDFEVQLV